MTDGWSWSEIEALADPRSFGRGLAYRGDGRVEIQQHVADKVTARVRGSLPYHVELKRAGKSISWSCTCPIGEEGVFCKHCVAVGLTVAGGEPLPSPTAKAAPLAETDLRRYLSGLDVDELVDLVLDQATLDWRLHERLTARAIALGGGSVEIGTWKKRIDAAFGDPRHFVSYAEAAGWAQDVVEVIEALNDLVDAGHAVAVIGLSEHAHRRADAAIQHVDDSDGCLTDISERLVELHLRSCESAAPDPVELGERLAELELTSELSGFYRAAVTYGDLLGEDGLAAYRRVVEPRWRAAAKRKDPYSHERFSSREAMIGIAQASGKPDDLIAIYRGELRSPHAYLEIAKALLAASRTEEAIDWARRGLASFTDRPWQTESLRELLARELRSRRRPLWRRGPLVGGVCIGAIARRLSQAGC